MLERSDRETAESPGARPLPQDDKVRFVVTECQRDLEAAGRTLQRFRQLWFVDDPPRTSEARELVLALLEEQSRIRNALLELKRVTAPI